MNKLTMAGLMTIAMGGTLFVLPWSVDPFVLPKLLVVALGAAIAHAGLARRARGQWRASNGAGGLFMIWGAALALSCFVSADLPRSLIGAQASFGSSVLGWAVLGLAARALVLAELEQIQALRMVSAAATPMAFYACVQRAGFEPFFDHYAFGGRAFSTAGGPVFLGSMLAVALPCCFWLLGRERGLLRLPAAAAVLFTAAGLVASGTRAAMGGAAVGCLIVAWRLEVLEGWVAAALGVFMASSAALSRAHALRSDLGRLEIWGMALRAIAERPLLGWGTETFEVISRRFITPGFENTHGLMVTSVHPHNLILAILYSTGAVGLAAAGICCVRLAYHRECIPDRQLPIEGPAIALLICSMVNPVPHGAVLLLLVAAAPALRGLSDERASAWRDWSACAGALAAVAICSRLVLADCWAKVGYYAWGGEDTETAAVAFNRAAELNPLSAQLVSRQLDFLRIMSFSMEGDSARTAVRVGEAIAQRNAAWHPDDALALETLGAQLALRGILFPAQRKTAFARSRAALAGAVRLAPTYSPMSDRARALEVKF